ncbi:hypothetical protein BH10ACI3_BH10ACI3_10420 [soil metagenome]
MKKFSSILLTLAAILFFGSMASYGQISAKQEAAGAKAQVIASIVSTKHETGPFVLIKPSDLEGLTSNELNSLMSITDPCTEALPIDFGQTVNGTLAVTDCQLDDDSYADFYYFTGTATQQVTITLNSSAFDTYLGLANETGTFVVEDDDGGGGTNSKIISNLPETGLYIILANSTFPNQFGDYSLNLVGSTVCSLTIDPQSFAAPAGGGTFSFAVDTQPGCSWSTNYDIYTFILESVTQGGTGPGTVNYTVTPNNSGVDRSTVIRVRDKVFTITQPFLVCTYSISPISAEFTADASVSSFMMNTPVGCPWTASYQNSWLWTSTELHRGPGPVEYTVAANNGPERTSTITIAGNTFTGHQAGRACTYSVTPMSLAVSPAGLNSHFTVDTQPGCTWYFSGGSNYIYFPDGNGGTGPGTKNFTVWPNYQFAPRNWIVQFTGLTTTNLTFTQNGSPYRTAFDFFGDSKADLGVFRPSTGQWIMWDSQFNGVYYDQFGMAGDVITPADFNGDRRTELSVFRPSDGMWYSFDRGAFTFTAEQFGLPGDIPAPADFDGDGKADVAVFRPSTGAWFIHRSSDGAVNVQGFGANGDKPVASDYDGDGKADIAIWRPEAGQWWLLRSGDGQVNVQQFGTATDKAVPGDYNGDGKTDIAVWRPSTGTWFVFNIANSSYSVYQWGIQGDIPVPADYDADGIVDVAIFRPSNATWYLDRSGQGIYITPFGQAGDVPVPSAFVR